MKSKIFFQSGFWNNINTNSTVEGIRAMLNVSDALSNSFVVTDVSEELIKNDPFLMVLIRQGKYNRCDEKYIDKKIETLNSTEDAEDLSATYLLDKKPFVCKKIEEKYGVIAVSSESIIRNEHLFKGDGFCLDKHHCYTLRYMTYKDKLRQPCNSLIIIDPYLLLDREVDSNTNSVKFPGISNNLESLLDAILPQELDVDFHLTIISSLKKGKEDVKKAYEQVKKCFKRVRNKLTFKLGFFYIAKGYDYKKESFHSRHILANSFLVDSEDGLDLFGGKGYITKNNPTVSIVFPWLLGNSRQDMTKYENWLRSVKKYVEESPDSLYYGTKENRLFNLVK